MAFGLPVEGEDGPFAGSSLTETPRCGPDERAGDVVRGLVDQGHDQAVVVNEHGVVLGLAQRSVLERSASEIAVAEVMKLSPSTVRPSVELSALADADEPTLVTNSDGVLLGVVLPRTGGPVSEHDAGSGDAGSGHAGSGQEAELQELQGTFLEVAHAIEEHFGGEEPSEDEVRDFLRQRLVAEGRSAEEADAYLAEMDRPAE